MDDKGRGIIKRENGFLPLKNGTAISCHIVKARSPRRRRRLEEPIPHLN